MRTKQDLKESCQRILEDNGGTIADKARKILLEDSALKDLNLPLKFISKTWRDPLTPSMITLSCQAVGGQSNDIYEVALAASLMSLSFNIWDDIVDETESEMFSPTLLGKFGRATAIIVGGLASAKAFSILNQMDMNKKKRETVTTLLWDFWTTIAKAETQNSRLSSQANFSHRKKLWIIKMRAANLETWPKIGAVLGDASEDEVKRLGNYGLYLGTILRLWKEFQLTINLTLSLAEKIRSGSLPYPILWAKERSSRVHEKIENLKKRDRIDPSEIKELVESVLETNALDNVMKNMRRFSKMALRELSKLDRKTNATQALKFFVEAQPQLFIESLSML